MRHFAESNDLAKRRVSRTRVGTIHAVAGQGADAKTIELRSSFNDVTMGAVTLALNARLVVDTTYAAYAYAANTAVGAGNGRAALSRQGRSIFIAETQRRRVGEGAAFVRAAKGEG